MVDNVVPTLAPERQAPAATSTRPAQSPTQLLESEKDALFDSIAHENFSENEGSESAPWKKFFTGLLWVGYAIAIVVALVLVWRAAGTLLKF